MIEGMRDARRLGAALLVALCAFASGGATYDHFVHGFDLEGAHEVLDCADCHKGGIFQGTPRQCSICHDGSNLYSESGPPFDHIQTTSFCEARGRSSPCW